MIEENKLEQLEQLSKPKEINPLLALLEEAE